MHWFQEDCTKHDLNTGDVLGCAWSSKDSLVKVIPSSSQKLGFLGGSVVKNLPVRQKMQEMLHVWSLAWGDPLEEGLATHSSVLALENPIGKGAWWGIAHSVAQRRT